MRQIISILLTLTLSLNGTSQKRLDLSFPKKSAVTSVQTKLNIPFGTIVKLNVEIYDGDSLIRKGYQSCYMLKVNSVNGKVLKDTLLLKFIDENETLANDNTGLSAITYGKAIDSLTDTQFYEMKKNMLERNLQSWHTK